MIFSLFANAQASSDDFVFTINTANPGSSNSSQFQFQFIRDTIDIDKDNDGIFDYLNVTGTSQLITYSTPGIYTVRVRGSFTSYSPTSDNDKILSIDQWGNNAWTFIQCIDCDSLTTLPSDTPDFSQLGLLRFNRFIIS